MEHDLEPLDWTDLVNICAIHSPKVAERVGEVLEGHGIHNVIHGSRGNGVFVRSHDVERAKKILIEDAEKNGYRIIYWSK